MRFLLSVGNNHKEVYHMKYKEGGARNSKVNCQKNSNTFLPEFVFKGYYASFSLITIEYNKLLFLITIETSQYVTKLLVQEFNQTL